MTRRGSITRIIVIIRTALLCAIVASALSPDIAQAHPDDATVHDDGHADHHDDRAANDTGFGHCHAGIDCALSALATAMSRLQDRSPTHVTTSLPVAILRSGIGLAYEPPPPRSFA